MTKLCGSRIFGIASVASSLLITQWALGEPWLGHLDQPMTLTRLGHLTPH
jgi:hypothetical protein